MSEDNVWVPGSGCLPCPLSANIDLGKNQPGSTINPFPGFANLKTGYFSIPMGTWYLPIQRSHFYNEDTIVGEIEITDKEKFVFILQHEYAHQLLHETAPKQMIRMLAMEAWEALATVTHDHDKDTEGWQQLQTCNNLIKLLTESIGLVEEVYTTWYGIEKSRPFIPADQLDRIKKQCLKVQTKKFGVEFSRLYKELEKACERAGSYPILLLSYFAQGWLDSEQTPIGMLLLREMSEEHAIKRLENGLEILKSLALSRDEAENLPVDYWVQLFIQHLPDFSRFDESIKRLESIYTNHTVNRQHWWVASGMADFNPILGAILYEQASGKLEITVCEPDISEISELDNTEPLSDKLRNAYNQNRTLVIIQPRREEVGFCFLLSEDNNKNIPSAYMLGDLSSSDRKQQWNIVGRALINGTTSLTFFEGLRQQVERRFGLRCPLQALQKGGCCGFREKLVRLWEVGKKATEKSGIPPERWEEPTCQHNPHGHD